MPPQIQFPKTANYNLGGRLTIRSSETAPLAMMRPVKAAEQKQAVNYDRIGAVPRSYTDGVETHFRLHARACLLRSLSAENETECLAHRTPHRQRSHAYRCHGFQKALGTGDPLARERQRQDGGIPRWRKQLCCVDEPHRRRCSRAHHERVMEWPTPLAIPHGTSLSPLRKQCINLRRLSKPCGLVRSAPAVLCSDARCQSARIDSRR